MAMPHREICPLFPSLTGRGAATLFLLWLFFVHSLFQVANTCLWVLPLFSAQDRGGTGYKYHYYYYIHNNIIPEWSRSTEIDSEHQCQQQEPLTSLNFNPGPSNPRKNSREFISTRISLLGLGTIRIMGWAADSNSLWWGLCCSDIVFQLQHLLGTCSSALWVKILLYFLFSSSRGCGPHAYCVILFAKAFDFVECSCHAFAMCMKGGCSEMRAGLFPK